MKLKYQTVISSTLPKILESVLNVSLVSDGKVENAKTITVRLRIVKIANLGILNLKVNLIAQIVIVKMVMFQMDKFAFKAK